MSKSDAEIMRLRLRDNDIQKCILSALKDLLTSIGGGADLATETTLTSVSNTLSSLLAENKLDFELRSVKDANNDIYQLRGTLDEETGVFTWDYIDSSGAVSVPVAPVEFLNPDLLLNAIITELQTLNAGGQLLTEATFSAEDFATETTLTALTAKLNSLGQKASAVSAPVVLSTEQEAILVTIDAVLDSIKLDTANLSSAATEATLTATNALLTTIDTVLDNILLDTTAIAADTSTLSTPSTGLATSLTRVTGAGAASVSAGKRRVSFFNPSLVDTTVSGGTLKAGEVVTFVADGVRDTLAAISYDALTGELLITTVG